MGYSVFEDTMADMNYQQIEQAAKDDAIVLFPVSVIEEHGPHMCLGTDTYLSYNVCRKVKSNLEKKGLKTLIVPPFYWGINHMTGAFGGSFTVRRSTMISVLIDVLVCLKNWGFRKIFLYNLHGDLHHNMAMIEAVKEARIDYGVRAFSIVGDYWLKRFMLKGDEDHILVCRNPVKEDNSTPETPVKPHPYIDVHAGSYETSLMLVNYPELVDLEKAKSLEDSKITWDDIKTLRKGWGEARNKIPLGYVGDPSVVKEDAVKENEVNNISNIANSIYEFCNEL